ncbi:hypothetical protein DYB37_004951 [Aphanomyces astaci]|uniref:Uncharacterized protein n=1 Tax=Aphanomyces astaci TaxID=112090 RepID=A0A3R6XSY5_APHAT|nr:hypothetical protein DYB35_006380 [Aphanomyces astaci]RHZ31026.1 hypothetical protein DYB37_004951 [Aphanomyces astaci]
MYTPLNHRVFHQVCVLRPNQPSTINVTSTTMVEVLELTQEGLAQINLKYNSRTMNALQESFLFHNPPNPKIAQLYKERDTWQHDKARIIRDVLNRGKQTGLVKRGAANATTKHLDGLHHRSSFYDNHL